MSTHQDKFSHALEQLNNGWSLQDVYRGPLEKSLREEFWFEWLPKQDVTDFIDGSDSLLEMCSEESFWKDQDPDVVEALLVHIQNTWRKDPNKRYPWGVQKKISSSVASSLNEIVAAQPSFFKEGTFAQNPELATLLQLLKWQGNHLPFDALDEETLDLVALHWIANKEAFHYRERLRLESRKFRDRIAAHLATFLQDYPEQNISWSNVGTFLQDLDPDQAMEAATHLSFSSSIDHEIYKALKAIVARRFPDNLDTFIEKYHAPEKRRLYPVTWMSLAMGALCLEKEIPFPTPLDEMLLEVVARNDTLQIKLFRDIIARHPIEALSHKLESLLNLWRNSALLSLIDLADQPHQIVTQILSMFWGYTSLSKYDLQPQSSIVQDLRKLPRETLVQVAMKRWEEDEPAKEQALILLHAVSHGYGELEAPLYLMALHHKSKPVRELAEQQLTALGQLAKDALEEGKQSKKKSVREFATQLLETLEAVHDEEIPTDEEREAHQRRVEQVRPLLKDYQKAAEFFRAHTDEPMAWFQAAMEVYAQATYAHAANHILRGTIDAYGKDKAHRDELWTGVLTAIAAVSSKLKKYQLKEALAIVDKQVPKEILDRELPNVLLDASGDYAPGLFKRYFTRAQHDPSAQVVIAGLEHKAKAVRDLTSEAVEFLLTQGAKERRPALVETMLEVLETKSKSPRELAAKALSQAEPELLKPHRETLEKLQASERSLDVQLHLDRILPMLLDEGEASSCASPDSGELSDWKAAQELLESMKSKKEPKFVDLDALPDLLWHDGETALSDKALKSLLTTLRQEGPDTQDPIARQIRPLLDDDSAHDFSLTLREQWRKDGEKSSHKWALYQQALFVKEERINELGRILLQMANYNHQKWYLDVFARHGSRAAHSWVVHCALNAERPSVYEHANHLVEELAREADMTPGQFRASVNLYISQDVFEQFFEVNASNVASGELADGEEVTFAFDFDRSKAVVERASGKTQASLPKETPDATKEKFKRFGKLYKYKDAQIKSYLEQCMISGRPWTVAQFESFFLEHPFVKQHADKLLFMVGDGQAFFHVHEGDLIDVEWEPLKLADDAIVKITHMYDLKDKNVDKWLAHMGEGDIIQPFAQLDRPFYEIGSEPELEQVSLATLAGRLDAQGWRNGRAEDAGMIYEASKIMPGRNVRVVIGHDGIYAGNPGMYKEQTEVSILSFQDLQGNHLDPKQVDPIAYSETWLSLTELTR